MSKIITNKMAKLMLAVADCQAQLDANAQYPVRGEDWEKRCRYNLARYKAQLKALRAIIAEAMPEGHEIEK
jgi:hypothetical protein